MPLSRKDRAERDKHRRGGTHKGHLFIQLPHFVKRSTSYHGLSKPARAFLTELIDRHNGSNNGFIPLGVRETKYELVCSNDTAHRVAREVDDADLAKPTKVGAWQGKQATEWRLTWLYCHKTGQHPRTAWVERTPYRQLVLPAPKKKDPLTDAERARRYRQRRTTTGFEVEGLEPCAMAASRKPSR